MTTLHTLNELAARAGVSRKTVNRWVAQGRVEVIRLGSRTTRVTDEEIERVLRAETPVTMRHPTPDP